MQEGFGRSVARENHAVVIAGGGPTGLMLAGELALMRVDVAIVERRDNQELAGSRAGGIHARTIEVLDQRGIVERFLAIGTKHQMAPFAGAMLDISDGLAADLNHICEESACGAVLFADAIPVSEAARELSRASGKTPLQHALGDGEDFELVFAVSPEDGAKLLASPPVAGLTRIGECVTEGLWLESAGRRERLEPTGWVHSL